MHHPRSLSAVRNFRLAAFMLVVHRLLAPAACALLFVSWIFHDRLLMIIGAALMLFSMVLVVAQWVAATRTGCPLCMTPVLASKACVKHRRARAFLGSHRLRVALAILFRSRFRCPYCNETTTMEVRETVHRSHEKRHLQPSRRCL